jgi:hypothetical protein
MKLRDKAIKELARNLGCDKEIAEGILKGMDKEAIEEKKLCAAEMA